MWVALVCLSVRPSASQSVSQSVSLSVRPSLTQILHLHPCTPTHQQAKLLDVLGYDIYLSDPFPLLSRRRLLATSPPLPLEDQPEPASSQVRKGRRKGDNLSYRLEMGRGKGMGERTGRGDVHPFHTRTHRDTPSIHTRTHAHTPIHALSHSPHRR